MVAFVLFCIVKEDDILVSANHVIWLWYHVRVLVAEREYWRSRLSWPLGSYPSCSYVRVEVRGFGKAPLHVSLGWNIRWL